MVVGAGFAGLYSLYKFKKLGLKVILLEEASEVGGTWFWNSYPGAKCDVESDLYAYSFSDDLTAEWGWAETFAHQADLQNYLKRVTEKFSLTESIQFNTKVTKALYSESQSFWTFTTQNKQAYTSRFCVMATGCLSKPFIPQLTGLEDFMGQVLHTARWPKKNINFTNKKVGVIGTGSSGVQVIAELAKSCEKLIVFQRGANFCLPVYNSKKISADINIKNTHELKAKSEQSAWALPYQYKFKSVFDLNEAHATQILEEAWSQKGLNDFLFCFQDIWTNEESNQFVSDFIKNKIKQIVKNKEYSQILTQQNYPFGAKRICGETGYYECFNQQNVQLIDIQKNPITKINSSGVVVANELHEIDTLVFATGFEAMIGALNDIEIVGRNNLKLKNIWQQEVKTNLGMFVNQFPNLFLITGPESPAVLTNMVRTIEFSVDWVFECINFLNKNKKIEIETTEVAQEDWHNLNLKLSANTFISKTNSWYNNYNGSTVQKNLLLFTGGYSFYKKLCEKESDNQYNSFKIK